MDDLASSGGRAVTGFGLGRAVMVVGPEGDTDGLVAALDGEGFVTTRCAPTAIGTVLELHPPDLVLVKVDPTDEGATAMCVQLRGLTEQPLFVVTPQPRRDDRTAMFDVGADAVVGDSIGHHEFLARVRALLRRSPPKPTFSPVLGHDGLQLDRRTKTLTSGGAMVPLEPQELQMMELLMTNGGRVTTRDELRTLFEASDVAIDGLVRRLRERLEAVEGWRRIVTKRGVGFQLLECPGPSSRADVELAGP